MPILDVDNLTLNPQEVEDYAAFIFERVFFMPELQRLHGVQTGVTMKEQIVFASKMGKTGIKADGTCDRVSSGATSNMSEKYWEPVGIEDLLQHCNIEMNGLFKAAFKKIKEYQDKYDIEGTETEVFIMQLIEESMVELIWRAAWFGDTAVAAADAGNAGLADVANVKFYDYFDGIWKQIFTGVTATDITRFTISKNSLTDPAAQKALGSGECITIFEGMWANADVRLRGHADKLLYVSHTIWENYRQYLTTKGENFTIEYTMQGFPMLDWQGVPIVDMEVVWDKDPYVDFVQDTTNNALYLPNRAVLTIPANIPIGTLNDKNMKELDSWYNKDTRKNNYAFGFTEDAKVLEEYMITVAY